MRIFARNTTSELAHEFYFKRARIVRSLGLLKETVASLEAYLNKAGKEGARYFDALKLLDRAEEQMRKAEAERKRIEAERRRVEALRRENTDQAKRQIEAASVALARDPLRSGGYAPEMVTVQKGRFQYEFTWHYGDSYFKRINPWKSFDKPFAISKHEITRGEFKRFTKATGYRPDSERLGCRGSGRDYSKGSWKRLYFVQTDSHPVVCVNRREAIAYAKWLSRETGQSYRLPTAIEWEYAARAGSQWSMLDLDSEKVTNRKGGYTLTDILEYWKAQGWTNHCGQANLRKDRRDNCLDGVENTAPVGSFLPNRIGLHDMIGNVQEWVSTCIELREDWHPEKKSDAIENCKRDMTRGDGYIDPGVGSSYKDWDAVGSDYENSFGRNSSFVGFRVVKDF